MNRAIRIALCLLMVVSPALASALGHGSGADQNTIRSPASQRPAASDSMEICANVPIPDGWVVVSIRPGCGTGFGLYEIRRVDPDRYPTMAMCAVTAVPKGWGVTSIQGGCVSGVPYYQIQYAGPNSLPFSVCNVPAFEMPKGWVATYVRQGCALPGYTYWYIEKALPERGTMDICNVAPIPEGWVIVAQRAGCFSSGGLLTIRHMP
ncbi:hypothetical protein M4R22_05905 [Acidovorax sp. GBBC 3334]|uniref:hypothetical protein n=1 Tax=Acidovorax sp. GBBC 3334 TaxID=2940496 RepID=UPI002301FE67|nr:hypothetical protein [Acidovorax sp. GBBC 3334]MDA8454290.1 hypothetical protein [Acidovorax sp. GBBC 3334]